jgi:hypothetical protein
MRRVPITRVHTLEYIREPAVQRAALRFALEGGSPQECLEVIDKQVAMAFNVQMRWVRNSATRRRESLEELSKR